MAKVDYLVDALGAWSRRTVCAYLLSRPEDLFTFDDLLTHLVTEARLAPDEVRPASTRRTDMGRRLHYEHLPRLATVDVVEYDREAKLVRPGPALATTERLVPELAEQRLVDSEQTS
ncbi:DUF7344 domain-containing protein [Halorientalis salina]|uniref:DUF7344 domain-containing protein n=1 Tax=Halorientalis salina TaxID=2932266 RepID=UPI0010AD777C|nr:hypothetical protein [Halorientalis salina]